MYLDGRHPGRERIGERPMDRDGVYFNARHCERSEAIQSGLRKLWIAARLRRSQ